MIWIVALVIVILIRIYFLNKNMPDTDNAASNEAIDTDTNEPIQIEEDKVRSYKNMYQRKYLLTKNEWYEYRKLREFAEARGLRVCPKVRLLDIVEPRSGTGYMSALGKIQSKHVDFVITDTNAYIKAIIELDDNSHKQADRQERDRFVDEVLTSIGYKVIRTYSITEETLKNV